MSASNAKFAGQVNFYAALDEPQKFATLIEGFPRADGDVRVCEFGSSNLPEYGGAKIRFSCKDSRGHLVVQVAIHENADKENSVAGAATVQLETVPAAIDVFVDELRCMRVQKGASATLGHAV